MLVRKHYHYSNTNINPFTPESDQCQISPPAPPEILHHTVRRTWLFIAYSDERRLQYNFSLPYLCIFSLGGWENVLFELRSERVKTSSCVTHLYTVYYAGHCMDTYCCTLPKDTISWEDGTFLLQTQDHVINGVARGVDCPQRSTICWQHVPIIQVAVVSWAATYFFLLLTPRKLGNPYLGSLGEGNGGQFMILTLSVLRSKVHSPNLPKEKMHKWCSENLYYNHLSFE